MVASKFSRIGFVLAAAGSAVGLGNVWKFPYMTGVNGGGAFVLVYLLAILFIGVVLFLSEVAMGRLGRKDPVSAFKELAPKGGNRWKFAGFIVFTPLLIVSFYTVVMGWLLKYIVVSFGSLPTDANASGAMFGAMISSSMWEQILYFTIAFFMVFYIVSRGIIEGIERANIILMPLLAIILAGLMFYAMSLSGFWDALNFLFIPDFSKINSTSILAAVGQAFFTLSLGVGTIMTYAAALPDKDNLFRSSLAVAGIDTIIAIVAGIMIFSFTFHFGIKPGGGPGLIFVTLPTLFGDMGVAGMVINFLLFLALAFAGVTSAISMVEPSISYMGNYLHVSRKKAIFIIGAIVYILGILALLSNVDTTKEGMTFFGKGFFDILDFVTSSILMPIGGILTCIFVGFIMKQQTLRDLFVPFMGESIYAIWMFFVRFVVPIVVFIIMVNKLFF